MSLLYSASASPRRKEILENIRLPIEILPSDVEENLDKEEYKEIIYLPFNSNYELTIFISQYTHISDFV